MTERTYNGCHKEAISKAIKEATKGSESELNGLLSGVLNMPMEHLSIDTYGHGEELKDEWPRYYNGHPVIDGKLKGTGYMVPPEWIKEL